MKLDQWSANESVKKSGCAFNFSPGARVVLDPSHDRQEQVRLDDDVQLVVLDDFDQLFDGKLEVLSAQIGDSEEVTPLEIGGKKQISKSKLDIETR